MRTACNLASFQFAFSAINEQPSMNRSRVVAGGGRQRPNHGEVITNLCIGWSQDRVQTSFVHEPNGMEPSLRPHRGMPKALLPARFCLPGTKSACKEQA